MTESEFDAPERRRIARVARCFSPDGRLLRWPSRRADQDMVLWVVWSQLPGEGQIEEIEINAMLKRWHDFEDYVLLRRQLCDMDLLRRTPDGRIYRRVARHDMPESARALAERFDTR